MLSGIHIFGFSVLNTSHLGRARISFDRVRTILHNEWDELVYGNSMQGFA